MKIEVNGHTYFMHETDQKWTLRSEAGKLSVYMEISKKDCKTIEELEEYIVSSLKGEGNDH